MALLVGLAFTVIQILPTGNVRTLLGFGWMNFLLIGGGVLARILFRALPGRIEPLRRALLTFGPWIVAVASWYAGGRAALYVLGVLAAAALIGATLAQSRLRPPRVPLLWLLASVALCAALWLALFAVTADPPRLPSLQATRPTLALPDPGAQGPYRPVRKTYGSGRDRHRFEYGAGADVLSDSVDGSALVAKWRGVSGALRSSYWGFDKTSLPLQARVWLPDAAGPFPVVLLAHGDHAMEQPSEAGYDYLGRHLASRGFVAVLVDQNFLNTSLADMTGFPFAGKAGLHGEHDLRAWLLLEHLKQWRRWAADRSHPLGPRADLRRVILAGHSVGGEAAALASYFNELEHYPDDATLPFHYGFGVRGVISLAGGDGYYLPRGQLAPLGHVSYLALQGSKDAQATSFGALAPAARTTLDSDPWRFLASAYVLGANHDHFNTSWGRLDVPDFWGWAVDGRHVMAAAEQQRVARVYFGAFAEVLLHDDARYLPLFEDARVGANWLPATHYLTHYVDSADRLVASFDEDDAASTTTLEGGSISAHGLSLWREEWVLLKRAPLGTHALRVAWDAEPGAAPRLVIDLPELEEPALALVFSLAACESNRDPIELGVLLSDAQDTRVRLPLSRDQLLYPQIRTQTRWPILEGRDTDEPLFRRYRFPLAAFAKQGLDPTQLERIELLFDRTTRGCLLLDNVGFSTRDEGGRK